MKRELSQKRWRALATGILLTVSASSVIAMPAFAAEYSQGLTGNVKKDTALLGADGSTVEKDGNKITYEFQGKDHTFNVVNKDAAALNKGRFNYVVNNLDSDDNKGTLHFHQTNTNKNDSDGVTAFAAGGGGKVEVNSNLDITAYSAYASVGITAGGSTELVINGNVKMRKDDPKSPWGIITNNVHGNIGPGGVTSMDPTDVNYTGARWQPNGFSVGALGTLNVNGNVDAAVRGTAVQTGIYNAIKNVHPYNLGTINLIGDSIKIETPSDERKPDGSFKEAYYAMASYGGTVNINVVDANHNEDKSSIANEKLVAAEGKTSNIIGNVIALKRSERTDKPDVYQDGRINIGLTTKESTWKGVVDNAGAAQAGEVNVWLSNGAQWTHEATSRVDGLDYSNMPAYSKPSYDNFDGVSYVNKLVGGKRVANTGYIYQNSDVKLNIANYSGYNTIVYKHNNNGTQKADYIGGDVTIQHAAAGANITLATDRTNINLADDTEIANVLNALASKLTYSDYVKGERELSGKVIIASGLTASSMTVDARGIIRFDEKTGLGGYTKPQADEQTENSINSAITGTNTDTAFKDANILQKDNSYKFTQSTTIIVDSGAAIDTKADVKINAENAGLTLDSEQGILTNGKKVEITARTLNINAQDDAITADGGKLISKGKTNINSEDKSNNPAAKNAVVATKGAEVTLGYGTIKGNIISDASEVTINEDNKDGSVEGNLAVANGGTLKLSVAGLLGKLNGDIMPSSDIATVASGTSTGKVDLTVANGAAWTGGLKDPSAELNLTLSGGSWMNNNTADTTVKSLKGGNGVVKTIKYKDPSSAANVDVEIPVNGYIGMQPEAGAVTIENYSGTHIVSYDHDNAGTAVGDYKGGNFTVNKADAGSMLIAVHI